MADPVGQGTPSSPIALSVRQPWAWAIVNGFKDVENRSWATAYRGPLLLHAGQQFDSAGFDLLTRYAISYPDELDVGAILGGST